MAWQAAVGRADITPPVGTAMGGYGGALGAAPRNATGTFSPLLARALALWDGPTPYVVVSADVIVAEDSATAQELASGYGQWVYSIRTGVGAVPYPGPGDYRTLTEEQLPVVKDRLETQFVGDPDEVSERLSALQRLSGADELVVTSVTHDHQARLRSHELLAKRWGISA